MSTPIAPSQVKHNTAGQRFEIEIDGLVGACDYTLEPRGAGTVMNMPHTYVPPELGGRGVAAALVQAALQWAQAQGYTVNPFCSYVRSYIDKHPEFGALRA